MCRVKLKSKRQLSKSYGTPQIIYRHKRLSLAVWIGLTAARLNNEHLAGYILSAVFFAFSLYGAYYFYRILWLHNRGRPLSKEKKLKREQHRKQMRGYQRYNLYHRLYRFADATEEEYQAQKAKETLKKIKH
jgi:hypothetical protein